MEVGKVAVEYERRVEGEKRQKAGKRDDVFYLCVSSVLGIRLGVESLGAR